MQIDITKYFNRYTSKSYIDLNQFVFLDPNPDTAIQETSTSKL